MSPSTATTWVIRVAACSFISLLLWQLKGSPKVDDLHMSYPNHSLKAAHMQDVADVEESLIETNYSIIVSTYLRVEHLAQFLDHIANGQLPHLDAVFIAWGLGAHDPPEWLDLSLYSVPVHLERARVNSLTERFRRPESMRTAAGLWIDDDIELSPTDIEFGFKVYSEYGQQDHRIVGYSGRGVTVRSDGSSIYEVLTREHAIVLTNAAFLDTTMLRWFWDESDARISQSIQFVDANMNCEDILFNFVVATHNHVSPILVMPPDDMLVVKSSGLSDKTSHYSMRTRCVQEFQKIWGMPLMSTPLRVHHSERERDRKEKGLEEAFRIEEGRNPWAADLSFKPPA
ncbi:MAG: hypothetical protein CYPHOPRED_001738 [Cyphobasidiales sp. Tagirdzhanova-0007]|nr:MAG: hypothetical protein CYPHOPRED_001738 [Cyphobasidiales sp. Tagirdzhanova-0007]